MISPNSRASEHSLTILYQLSKLTAAEAVTFLTRELFSHNWKHGKDKQLGMMWRDSIIVSAFTHVLEEEDRIQLLGLENWRHTKDSSYYVFGDVEELEK